MTVPSSSVKRPDPEVRAQARARALRLETYPQKLLTNPRGWSSLVVRILFERAELHRLDDPLAAWERLRRLPPTLKKIPIGNEPTAFPSAAAKAQFAFRVQALLGETAAMARLDGPAEDAFTTARRFWESGTWDAAMGAEYFQRLAARALRDGRDDDAAELAERALELAGKDLPEPLLIAGLALGEREGLSRLTRSFRCNAFRKPFDETHRNLQLRLANKALSVLVRDLSGLAEEGASHVCREVEEQLQTVNRLSSRSNAVIPGYFRWAWGLAAWGTGLDRWAMRKLAPVPDRLRPCGDIRGAAWAGLDLARVQSLYAEDPGPALEQVRRDLPAELRPLLDGEPTPEHLRAVHDRLVEELPLPGLSAYPEKNSSPEI